ncbi:MAG: glycosyltransferase [Limosilactobacillus sp.]|uniref:glycosyltransferase family 2 protein n=1 Tax=Limosilactobacillus sp. TaxID=2773925 RepID=UPI00270C0F61|nr:glycosyltransferase [Limosilactobacillus sp.]
MKQEESAISVVIPVYNVAKYFAKCIESIINQSYKNIEIILVNDGSTDNSLEICNQYAAKDDRITVVSQTNQGLSEARNTGIRIAKGPYIMFVDSDDYVPADYCKDAIENVQKFNSDVAIFGYYRVDGQKAHEHKIFDLDDGLISKEMAMESTILYSYAWNKIYKLSLFDEIKYPRAKYYEDSYTTYRLFEKAGKISFINKSNYYYVNTGESIVSNMNEKTISDQFESLYNQFEFFKDSYPDVYNKSKNELIIKALRYMTFCPKSHNLSLYQSAYGVLKNNKIPKNIGMRYKVTMGLFKASAPLAISLFQIQRKRRQN